MVLLLKAKNDWQEELIVCGWY